MLQDGWEYFTWLRHQSLGEKNIFYLCCFVIISEGKRLGSCHRAAFIEATAQQCTGLWHHSINILKDERDMSDCFYSNKKSCSISYRIITLIWPQKRSGSPYGSQFSLGTSWHSGFSFHGPSKTSTCSSLQHFSLLQWRALVEHHCRQSSFRIVSPSSSMSLFISLTSADSPTSKYLPLWDLRASWEAN